MALDFYRFRSVWRAAAAPDEVFHVLADLGNYPLWWPEVRSVRKVTEDCAELTCRSLLPYDLSFRAAHSAKDEHAGLLRARLTGDLDGFASWRISGIGRGSRLVYDQEVTLRKRVLYGLTPYVTPFVRPALRANHELMMRSGQRGLRAYVAGWVVGRKTGDGVGDHADDGQENPLPR